MKLVNHKFTMTCIAGLSASFMLSGCNSLSPYFESDRIDYKSAGQTKAPSLAVPPDLSKVVGGNQYVIPGNATSLSEYNKEKKVVEGTAVLPQFTDMQVHKEGDIRWLTVNKPPAEVWPTIRDFWQENGFILEVDSAETGLLETDWAENRAKIPDDIIRRTLGKVLDSAYSTGERDKFRTRVERNAKGGTDIYIAHRGVEEVLVGQQKETSRWTPRPPDPNLEADFLARLMVRLGETKKGAQDKVQAIRPAANKSSTSVASNSRVTTAGGVPRLELNEPFDRAWRTVSVGLDRLNFTVEDRDRNKGTFTVRYIDPKLIDQQPGFLDRLFSGKSADDLKKAVRYNVVVSNSGNQSNVTVVDEKTGGSAGENGKRILNLLDEQTR